MILTTRADAGDRTEALAVALPERFRRALGELAWETQTSRGRLLSSLLQRHWEPFSTRELLAALAVYRHAMGGNSVGNTAPDWLLKHITDMGSEERIVTAILTITPKWKGRIAASLARAEERFYIVSLSEVMALFFAYAWNDFEKMWRERPSATCE